jgi:HEAT repeat protein
MEISMKRSYGKFHCLCLAAGLLFVQGAAWGQEPVLRSYERSFIRANLPGKADVLRDAASDRGAAEFMGELYQFALDFVLQNAEVLRDDPDLNNLATAVSRGLRNAGTGADAETLWQVFSSFRDSAVRVAVLNSLALLGQGNASIRNNLNQYLANQSSRYRSGVSPDYPVLSACIAALGALGDESSFPALFSVLTAGYPEPVTREVSEALGGIEGDYQQYLIGVIRNNPPVEKMAAFNTGIRHTAFTEAERGEIAEIALETVLELYPGGWENETAVTQLRYQAARALGELQWTRATDLLIGHYYRVQRDYGSGTASRERFLETIYNLGAMGSSDAARVLSLQMGYINAQMEQNRYFDESITLEVINALGRIGDRVAFDHLSYISYLAYPEGIQNAARDALGRLKW